MAKVVLEVDVEVKKAVDNLPAIKNKRQFKKAVHNEAVARGLVQMFGKKAVPKSLHDKYIQHTP